MRSSTIAAVADKPYIPYTSVILQHLLSIHHPAPSVDDEAAPPSAPLHLRLATCILFIDISGFTRLTESFASSGKAGLENLAQLLSDYSSTILNHVQQCGGDLIKIAGDALIVAFVHELDLSDQRDPKGYKPPLTSHPPSISRSSSLPSPLSSDIDEVQSLRMRHRLSQLCYQAISCALSLQHRMSLSSSSDALNSLKMHIGVTSGEIDFIAVGGSQQNWSNGRGHRQHSLTTPDSGSSDDSPYVNDGISPLLASQSSSTAVKATGQEKWEFLAVGPAFLELASCVDQSEAGQVVISSSTLERLKLIADVDNRPAASKSAAHTLHSSSPTSPESLSSSSSHPPLNYLIISCEWKSNTGQASSIASTLDQRPITRPKFDSPCSVPLPCFLMPALLTRLLGTEVEFNSRPMESTRWFEGNLVGGTVGHTGVLNSGPTHFSPLNSTLSSPFSPSAVLLISTSPAASSSSPSVSVMPPHLSSSRWLGEYRRVSVLFVSLPDPSTLPDLSPTTSSDDRSSPPPRSTSSQSPPLSSSSLSTSSSSPSPSSSSFASAAVSCSPGWLFAFHDLFRLLQSIVFNVAGQIRQLLVDDKGCVLIVVFGLPPLVYEDSATRAVVAGLRIVQMINAHPRWGRTSSALTVGITTGRAWCGSVGDDTRKEYTVVGDIVNLSARIMNHPRSRGRVVCDDETKHACGDRIVWKCDPETIHVKGKQKPIDIWTPLHRGQHRSQSISMPVAPSNASHVSDAGPISSPHTGNGGVKFEREDACDGIMRVIEQGKSGFNPVILVTAAAGQGKTHLGRSVLVECAAQGRSAVIGHADSMETSTVYYAFTSVVRQIIQSRQIKGSRAEASSILRHLLPEEDRSFTSVLEDVLHLVPTSANLTLSGDDESDKPSDAVEIDYSMRAVILRRLIRNLVKGHFQPDGDKPAPVLFIEDAHWLDVASWVLVKEIAETLPSVTLLLTTRPIPPSQASVAPTIWLSYQAVQRVARCHRVELRGMDERHSAVLIATSLNAQLDQLSPQLVSLIHRRADGTPLFIQQLCSHLQQRQLITTDARTGSISLTARDLLVGSAAAEGWDDLPDSLDNLLASVLDRLDEEVQLSLKVASVIGRHFMCTLVHAVHPKKPDLLDVLHQMTEAQRAHILDDWKDPGEDVDALVQAPINDRSYRFVHQLLRDAAYNALLYHQRRDLHAKIAHLLMESFTSKAASAHWASIHHIALHYWLALTTSNDALAEKPDQPLLLASIDCLLQSISASLAVDAVEDAVVGMARCSRCIRLVLDKDEQEYRELRLLQQFLGTQLMLNTVVCFALAGEMFPDAPRGYYGPSILRPAGERLIHLLDSPRATVGQTERQIQHSRFTAQVAFFLVAWISGDSAVFSRATKSLTEVALTMPDDEKDVYMTEALHAQVPCYIMCGEAETLRQCHATLDGHPHYQQLLTGKTKPSVHGYPFGHSAIACLGPYQCDHQWSHGRLKDVLRTMQLTVERLDGTHHVNSCITGALMLFRALVQYGDHPDTRRHMTWVVNKLPSHEHPSTVLYRMIRRTAQFALRWWSFLPSSHRPPTEGAMSEEAHSSVIDELLAIMDEVSRSPITVTGPHFGPLIHALPTLLDLPLSFPVPLVIEEGMMTLLDTPGPCRTISKMFDVLHWRTERRCNKAAVLIHQCAQGRHGPLGGIARRDKEKEAELILSQCRQMAREDGVMLELKVVMLWCELWAMQGKAEQGMSELQAVLDRIDCNGVRSAYIDHALRLLVQLRTNHPNQGELDLSPHAADIKHTSYDP